MGRCGDRRGPRAQVRRSGFLAQGTVARIGRLRGGVQVHFGSPRRTKVEDTQPPRALNWLSSMEQSARRSSLSS